MDVGAREHEVRSVLGYHYNRKWKIYVYQKKSFLHSEIGNRNEMGYNKERKGIFMRIAIGCDHAAYALKVEIMKHLDKKEGIEYVDFGSGEGEVVNYPDIGYAVADAVASGEFERGILVCGTGIGMAICANKVPGIRAAVCHDPYSTERARKSNDAQIMCMGARVIGMELAKTLVDTWLQCDFEGGGSAPKLALLRELELEHIKNAK